MESFDFFPFVTPSNVNVIVFPDFDTSIKPAAPTPIVSTPVPEAAAAAADVDIDVLNQSMGGMKIESAADTSSVDFDKIKRSNQKAGKSKDIYSLSELKTIAKDMNINFKGNISKKNLISSILKKNKIF